MSLATPHQYAEFSGAVFQAAQRELECACDEGVGASKVVLRRLRGLSAPVYSEAEGPLNANAVAKLIRQRWKGVEPEVETVYFLGSQILRPAHIEHDLHVTDMFLHYRKVRPDLTWISEKQYTDAFGARRRGLNPDGALLDRSGSVVLVLDFVSSYRAPKLKAIAAYWNRINTPFELW